MTKPTAKTPKKSTKTAVKAPKTTAKPAKTLEIGEKAEEKSLIINDLCSISALSKLYNIDRATVRDRIEKAGIKANSIKEREKLYELDEHLEMILRQDELAEAKLEKLRLEGERLKFDLAVKNGEFASVAEFNEIGQKVFGKLIKVLSVQLPNQIANRLHNAHSASELKLILKTEIDSALKEAQKRFDEIIAEKQS